VESSKLYFISWEYPFNQLLTDTALFSQGNILYIRL
jgi:hypothetical protein